VGEAIGRGQERKRGMTNLFVFVKPDP